MILLEIHQPAAPTSHLDRSSSKSVKMRMKGKLKTKVLSFLLGPLTWVDSFDTDGKKTFTDYEAAGEDWRANDTVSTILRHIAHSERWEKEKPFCLNLPLPEGQPKSNFIGSNHTDIPICNVRGREGDFKLDIHGFAFTKLPVFQASFEDTDEIETTYLAGMEDFLKRELQADEVFIFDYTVRKVFFVVVTASSVVLILPETTSTIIRIGLHRKVL